MIAHVILRRTPHSSASTSTIDSAGDYRSSSSLGLKVVGGRPNLFQPHQLSAYVVHVRKDSVADTIGRLQAGDELIKWNDTLLHGLTFDEVYAVMLNSKNDSQIELVVERTLE